MPAENAKKTLILNILSILRKYSDEGHPLTQQDFLDLLQTDYGMTVDRKSVKRNLDDLIDLGYDIEYREVSRARRDPVSGATTENPLKTDFYLSREFTDSELHLLIDSVLCARFIPEKQSRGLVKKLADLSSVHFHARAKHITPVGDTIRQNKQLFHTISVLDEAIEKGRKVTFHYTNYGTDKKLHPRMAGDKPKEYGISPYQMVVVNSRYYLICSTNNHPNVSHYRVDKITDIRLTNEPAVPQSEITGLEHGLNLPKHLAEHMNMLIGDSAQVSFRFQKKIINEVVDTFGTDVRFTREAGEWVEAMVTVNEEGMKTWALQHLPTVVVTQPRSLVEMIRKDILTGLENYPETL